MAAVITATPGGGQQFGGQDGDQGGQVLLQLRDLGGQGRDAGQLRQRDPLPGAGGQGAQPGLQPGAGPVRAQRPRRRGQLRGKVVHHPAQPVHDPGPLSDQVHAVISQPPHLQDLLIEAGGRQACALAQRQPRDRQRVDRVGLAPLPAAAPLPGHQLRRHEHDLLSGRQQFPDQAAGHMPHVLHRPQPPRGQLPGPGDQLPVPVPPCPHCALRLLAAQLISRDRGVGLLVRVHPDYHHQCLQSQIDAEAPGSRHGGHISVEEASRLLSSHAAPGPRAHRAATDKSLTSHHGQIVSESPAAHAHH